MFFLNRLLALWRVPLDGRLPFLFIRLLVLASCLTAIGQVSACGNRQVSSECTRRRSDAVKNGRPPRFSRGTVSTPGTRRLRSVVLGSRIARSRRVIQTKPQEVDSYHLVRHRPGKTATASPAARAGCRSIHWVRTPEDVEPWCQGECPPWYESHELQSTAIRRNPVPHPPPLDAANPMIPSHFHPKARQERP